MKEQRGIGMKYGDRFGEFTADDLIGVAICLVGSAAVLSGTLVYGYFFS